MINKFLHNKSFRISILIFIITIQAGGLPIGSTFVWWFIDFVTLYTIFQFRKKSTKYITIELFMIWTLISLIRGALIAENYWEWKQLISGILSLSIPICVYAFDKPIVTGTTLKFWFKYALLFFIICLPQIATGAYHFYLGPIFLIGCFIPIVPNKWKFILTTLLIIMLLINQDARSQVIKSAIVLVIAICIYTSKFFFSNLILKIIHWACYIIPIILLILGVSGRFNIFQDFPTLESKTIGVRNRENINDQLSADTRTFIYVEVIESALKHNYTIWGRTPARGNDSESFGTYNAEVLKTGKYERHKNELCHLNIFTWLGLIGVILYSLIYIRGSYLAIYKSNNIYIKFLGCFIAFRWAYGWIEDMNNFDIMNIALWMIIAMGQSQTFRMMNNKEFKKWILKSLP